MLNIAILVAAGLLPQDLTVQEGDAVTVDCFCGFQGVYLTPPVVKSPVLRLECPAPLGVVKLPEDGIFANGFEQIFCESFDRVIVVGGFKVRLSD